MTWQENLRQLDVRLANGDISANEYRKTRDEILAEASSNSAKEPGPEPWASTPPAENGEQDADTTLVVKVDQTEDETQIVPADAIAATPAAAPPGPPPPVSQPGPPPPGPGPQPGPPDVMATPYRAAPPLQGHEVFAEAAPKRRGTFTRFLVPLVILAVVAAGVWWFVSMGDDENSGSTPPPSQSGEKALDSDAISGRLPELPGKASTNDSTMALDRARELKLFTPAYAKLLADNGASEIVYRGATRSGFGYLLVTSPIGSAADAAKLAGATRDHLGRAGFKDVAELSQDGPPVITRTDRSFRTLIAVYSSGNVWVQLNVSGAPDGDEGELRADFRKVLASLTEGLPAD
jgi:hypothetical protein